MTAYDGLILNTDNSEAEVPQSGDTYNFPRAATFQSSITLGGETRTQWGTLIDSGTATSGGASTLTDSGADWGATGNPLAGSVIKITGGTGAEQTRGIASHTGTVITTDSAWTTPPDATSTYEIYGTGNQTLPQVIAAGDLGAITATLVKNAVAYAIYDVKNDSDGGRKITKGCVHTSMGNQVAKQLVVLEAATLNLYDLTDPSVTLLKSWTVAGGTSVAVLNGKIVYGGTGGLYIIDLIADVVWRHDATNLSRADQNAANYNQGTATFSAVSTAGAIVNATVNAVAITVLDDAPIDSATGLPKPTIAAATAGGVSVVNNDGTVADSTTTAVTQSVYFDADGYLYWSRTGGLIEFAATYAADGFGGTLYTTTGIPAGIGGSNNSAVNAGNVLARGQTAGLELFVYNKATKADSLMAYITNTYSTGWMVGDVRGAWLANSTTADRCVHANALTENGTVPVTTVTNGVNQYGPYTAANNHTAASNAEWDVITTGAFYQVLWFKCTGNSAIESLSGFANAGNTIRNLVILQADGTVRAIDDGATAAVNTDSPLAYDDGNWHQAIFVRASSTSRALYIDGNLVASNTTDAGSLTGTGTLPFAIGVDPDGSTTPATTTQLALVRIGATDITAEQAKYMYETEKPLFASGALALLSAAAGTDLDYNADAEILKVETAAANDFLHGLEVTTRGAALTDTTDRGFDYVTVNGTTDIRPAMTARTLRDELADKAEALAKAQQGTEPETFTLGAGVTSLTFVGRKPIYCYDVTGTAPLRLIKDTNLFFDGDYNGQVWRVTGLTATQSYDFLTRRV